MDCNLSSRYVWRGLVFDSDPVMQPDIWMQIHGIKMTFWGNLSLTDSTGKFEGQFNEWDTFFDFTAAKWKKICFGGGLYYESFPNSTGIGTSTAEVSVWVSGDVPGSPNITVNWDIWQLHGVYVNMGLSHLLKLGPGELAFGAASGWGDERHNRWSGITDVGSWLDLQGSVSYSLPVNTILTVCPCVAYSAILQNKIADYYRQQDVKPAAVYFSVMASVAIAK